MALNWQTFKTRTLTAVIFVAVMVAGLFLNQWSFLILFSIIHFGCWWEYFTLIEKIHKTFFHPYVKLGFMLMGYSLLLWFCGPGFHLGGYGLKENLSLPVSAAGFTLLIIGVFQRHPVNLKAFGIAAIGILYISLSWGLMMDLFEGREILFHDGLLVVQGPSIPAFIIGSIWINDTMAYIVGSFIGKTPLSKISPKKTWEGTIGGILLSVLVAGSLSFFLWKFEYLTILVMMAAAIAAITGTIGDLLESWLKRMAGVKDSGTLMPGHGGFLDRFDSLLVATVFVWLCVTLVEL